MACFFSANTRIHSTTWLMLGVAVALGSTVLGHTYALDTSSTTQTAAATYSTLSGSSAFKTNRAFVDFGTLAPGDPIPQSTVFTVTNNTGRRKISDLTVVLVQDSPELIGNVNISVSPSVLNAGAKANVRFSGTVGQTSGTISGYFLVSGLNGFLTLAIPVFGTVTAPAAAPASLETLQEPLSGQEVLVPAGSGASEPIPESGLEVLVPQDAASSQPAPEGEEKVNAPPDADSSHLQPGVSDALAPIDQDATPAGSPAAPPHQMGDTFPPKGN